MAMNFYRLARHGWGRQNWYGWFGSDGDAIATFTTMFKDDQRRGREADAWDKERTIAMGKKYRRLPRKKNEWVIERFGYMKPGNVASESKLPWKVIHTIQAGDE